MQQFVGFGFVFGFLPIFIVCEKSQYIIRQSMKKNNYKYLSAIAFEKPI